MKTLPKNASLTAVCFPDEVHCCEMTFTVPGKCLTPLDHGQQQQLLAALQPIRLDWKHPQRDRRGFQAWVYFAPVAGEEILVAVVLDDQGRLLKLRGLIQGRDGRPEQTLVFATFAPPSGPAGLKPRIAQRPLLRTY